MSARSGITTAFTPDQPGRPAELHAGKSTRTGSFRNFGRVRQPEPFAVKSTFHRHEAIEVAKELTALLRPLCLPEKFICAGSLRRRKMEVGDIEFVMIPELQPRPDPGDLFGRTIPTNLAEEKIAELLTKGHLSKRLKSDGTETWGEQNKLAVHVRIGVPVDFFFANKDNFYSLLVCRTGPKESNIAICTAANRRGLNWDPYAGIRDSLTRDLVFVPRSEKALFDYLNLPYKEPWDR